MAGWRAPERLRGARPRMCRLMASNWNWRASSRIAPAKAAHAGCAASMRVELVQDAAVVAELHHGLQRSCAAGRQPRRLSPPPGAAGVRRRRCVAPRQPELAPSQSSSSPMRTGLTMKSGAHAGVVVEVLVEGVGRHHRHRRARSSPRRAGGGSFPSRRCRAWPGPSRWRRARPGAPAGRALWPEPACAARSPAAPAGSPAARGRPPRCPPPGCVRRGPS